MQQQLSLLSNILYNNMVPGTIVPKGKLASTGGIQGVPGIQGIQGIQGPSGLIEEAPLDGKWYARSDATWVDTDLRFVKKAGDQMTGQLRVQTANASLVLWDNTSNTANTPFLDFNTNAVYGKDALRLYKQYNENRLAAGYWDAAGAFIGYYFLDTYHKVAGADLAAGAAVTNIGYTPVNRAGDTMTGVLRNNAGRVISQLAGSQPGFCCHDPGIAAGGMMMNTDGTFYLCQMDGNGAYLDWYAYFTTANTALRAVGCSSLSASGNVSCGSLNSSGPATVTALTSYGQIYGYANITCAGARIISQSPGANAMVCVYDTSTRCTGLWQNGQSCYLANCDGSGNYIGDWFWYVGNDYTFTPRWGIRYSNYGYGSSNQIGFGWGTYTAGYVTVSVDGGGAVYPIASASDSRMKQDITLSKFDCLATLEKLPLAEYRWRDYPRSRLDRGTDEAAARAGHELPDFADPWRLREAKSRLNTHLTKVGLIAQQVAKIFPDGVIQGDNFDDHLGRVWCLDQNNMLALCVGAIQQLNKDVRELKQKIL
jgi:hypothetical protein